MKEVCKKLGWGQIPGHSDRHDLKHMVLVIATRASSASEWKEKSVKVTAAGSPCLKTAVSSCERYTGSPTSTL